MSSLDWTAWLTAGGVIGGSIVLALIIHRIFFWVARRWSENTPSVIDSAMVEYGERPARFILVIGAIMLAFPALPPDHEMLSTLRHILGLGIIAAIAWLLIALVEVINEVTASRYNVDVEDNLHARRIRTQVRVLRRVSIAIIGIIAVAVMLMTFPEVRRIGEGLFASAGIAAIIAGIAARPTLSSLIAGVQLALTEPIRIDDVVVVEGEWGKIEEIGSAYVVVRIWDQRRLIVPLTYFIEKPFENWTRQTANLIGTVYLYMDYEVPVDEVRQELHRVLERSGIWDGQSWALQVTDSTEHTVELRALMSAPNSSVAWDLRCYVREQMIRFLQHNFPESLPRTRAEIRQIDQPKQTPNQNARPSAIASH